MKKIWPFLLAGAVVATPVHSQSNLEAICGRAEVQALRASDACYAAVQAAVSGQPALGLVLAGGNPTFGTAGATGLRLGTVPRTSAGLRLNFVGVRLPGIIADDIPGALGDFSERFGAPVPALLGDISIGLTTGLSAAPGLGGIGALSVIGAFSYLPFDALGIDGFEGSPDFAWGIGGRMHLIRESFVAPAVSASLIRRRLNTIQFGDVCSFSDFQQTSSTSTVPVTLTGLCAGPGDAGEFRLDLTDWSGRLVASKNLLGFGLSAGLGYDRYHSDLGYGFRAPEPVEGTDVTAVYRVARDELESERYSVFGSLSYTLIIGTFGIEAGWQQGEAPIAGFRDLETDFDPENGVWFATLGTRLSI